MTDKFNESTVEAAVLQWLAQLDYDVLHGPEIAPGEVDAKRGSFADVVLMGRLQEAVERINPEIPDDAVEEVLRRVTRAETPSLVENNRRFHQLLVEGVDVEYRNEERTVHDKAWLIDFEDPEANDWLAVNQFTVTEDKHTRRMDVNGLPLVVIELKNAADEHATTRKAFDIW